MSQKSQPMLSIEPDAPSDGVSKTTAHLLPCRVHHDGSVEPAESFWEPKTGPDGTSTAYFRGRKLEGKTVKVPEGYRGVVAVTSADAEPRRRPEEAELDLVDVDALVPTSSMQVRAEFDQMVVWTHGTAADASADPHTRGIEEWISLAERLHSYDAPAAKV